MKDTKIMLPAGYLFGEVRKPRVLKKMNDSNVSCLSFTFEFLGTNRVQVFYQDDCYMNKDTGEYKHIAIFDELAKLRHGTKCILNVSNRISINNDNAYVNTYINGVYPLDENLIRVLSKSGVSLE